MKICIDPGHGGHDPEPDGIWESSEASMAIRAGEVTERRPDQ
jgi:N-acetylmuramoyl-L-alanine amidase